MKVINNTLISFLFINKNLLTQNEIYFGVKRDGKKEPVMFDKITARVKKMCYGLNKIVDPVKVVIALKLAKENKVHAINFGPFNKTSMKLGGNKYSDECKKKFPNENIIIVCKLYCICVY